MSKLDLWHQESDSKIWKLLLHAVFSSKGETKLTSLGIPFLQKKNSLRAIYIMKKSVCLVFFCFVFYIYFFIPLTEYGGSFSSSLSVCCCISHFSFPSVKCESTNMLIFFQTGFCKYLTWVLVEYYKTNSF